MKGRIIRGYYFRHGEGNNEETHTHCFVFPGVSYFYFNIEQGIAESSHVPDQLEDLVKIDIEMLGSTPIIQ